MRGYEVPPCPARLSPQGSVGAKEQAEAIAHYCADDGEVTTPFKFRAYQHKDVRDALFRIFHGVCAYCEAPVRSIEIEHYRPKGSVKTEAGESPPGYYWLAATWANLLPSCHDCNHDRWVLGPDGPTHKSGKGTWFPLEDESTRATKKGEEAREVPLLLHPYLDEPEKHLEFGEQGVVGPRCDAQGKPSRKGEETIRVLGLNRRGLFEFRRERRLLLELRHERLLEAQRRCKEEPTNEELAEARRQRVEELKELLRPDQGFSGMAAQMLGLIDVA